MCYTIEKNLTRELLEKRFGAGFKPNRPFSPGKRVSAFSLPDVPIISSKLATEIDVYTWGLIPFWIKTNNDAHEIRMKTFNAKAETIKEKPSFRHTIKNQRCLVLTNGFYEWQHVGKEKIPYFIQLKDDIAMPMAGLSDSWTNIETGEILNTFTIITTRANMLMEEIHNTKKRMPVILTSANEKKWLDDSLSEKDVLELLNPIHEQFMMATKLIDADSKQQKLPKQQSLF
jgi:putative SOS response-associated peptidase YedK